jgi:ankyrin repeat protein
MKKKNVKSEAGQENRNSASSNPSQIIQQLMQNFRLDHDEESYDKMFENDLMSLEKHKAMIRNALIAMGTNCKLNDNDPMGNGDQSRIATKAQREAAQELFSTGADVHAHFEQQKLSPFVLLCLTGQIDMVRMELERETSRLKQPWTQHTMRSSTLKALLDRRETSLRLSPLLLLASLGKNMVLPFGDRLGVAKLLLEYGASPHAQDVLGKTVCHYGAGSMANEMSLDLVDMCIEASKSVHLYGKEVELNGMNDSNDAIQQNGLKGIVGGYRCDSGERSVYLIKQEKQVWIKPQYLRLLETNGSNQKGITLVNVQDRQGLISLHEVVMYDRVDVATFLLKKHKTSIHIKEMDGISPLRMSLSTGMLMSSVCKMVNEVNQAEAGKRRKKAKASAEIKCAHCMKKLSPDAPRCAICKTVQYCGRKCQRAHWVAGHKKECSILAKTTQGVRLDAPDVYEMSRPHLSCSSGNQTSASYRKPDGVTHDELFLVKVQINTSKSSVLIYDETRGCQFTVRQKQHGFQEVVTETQKEKAWDGRKTFMRASFDEAGICTIFPHTAQIKAKYKW